MFIGSAPGAPKAIQKLLKTLAMSERTELSIKPKQKMHLANYIKDKGGSTLNQF